MGVVLPVRPLGGHHGRVFGTWWAGFRNIGRAVSGTALSGAAGSRTRVPRPRCSGLYVRRSRSVSDRGAPRPSSSADLATCDVPRRPVAQASRWSLVDDDPVPLRGVRGGSARVFTPRVPLECWHLWVPTHFVEVTSASSARSPGIGIGHGRNHVSPRCGSCASTLCSCQGVALCCPMKGNAARAPRLPAPDVTTMAARAGAEGPGPMAAATWLTRDGDA